MFKLIAIEVTRPMDEEVVTTERYKSIHKIMSFTLDDYGEGKPASRLYYLQKGYKCINNRTTIDASSVHIADDFFTSNGTRITFSAIVGENGMGKSTLLELFFRLMNNTSYVLRYGIDSSIADKLIFVPDLYVRAYFQDSNGEYFSIEQYDNNILFFRQGEEQWRIDYNLHQRYKPTKYEIDEKIQALSSLFYTVVVNYASYAYNTTDYIKEWDRIADNDTRTEEERCWLSSLFHKNDSYQTPIVLNPFRESGNVDYNNERALTQERLFRLVLNQHSPLKRILYKKDAKAIIFSLNYDYYPKRQRNHYESERVLWTIRMLHLTGSGTRKRLAELTNIGDCIVRAWSRCLGFKLDGQTNLYWDNKERVCAVNYLVYKTLKIINTYPSYQSYKIKLFQGPETHKDLNGILRDAIKKMYGDKSHITIKIRRCLSYLLFKHYTSIQTLGLDGVVRGKIINIDALQEEMNKCIQYCAKYMSDRINENGRVKIIGYANKKPLNWTFEELMPASFFHTDLLLQDEEGHDVNFNLLSSGEKQMIYSMSAILYQIGNIESAWNNTAKQAHYSKICLVFDEVELYFHPKYQLKLVSFLIETLQGLNLNNIKDIHIILATHSPFILSDIPASNILLLKEGRAFKGVEENINPFCANVYDILNNQFFMDRFVGDFANQKINNVIKRLSAEKPIEAEEEKDIENTIRDIGDSFIKGLLKKKLQTKRPHD